MKAIAFLIIVLLGADLSWAGMIKAAPKPQVIDLDFTDDDYETPGKRPDISGGTDSLQWIFWTIGGAVAAAGGVGWYLHKDQHKDPVVTRNDQIFTDERP